MIVTKQRLRQLNAKVQKHGFAETKEWDELFTFRAQDLELDPGAPDVIKKTIEFLRMAEASCALAALGIAQIHTGGFGQHAKRHADALEVEYGCVTESEIVVKTTDNK